MYIPRFYLEKAAAEMAGALEDNEGTMFHGSPQMHGAEASVIPRQTLHTATPIQHHVDKTHDDDIDFLDTMFEAYRSSRTIGKDKKEVREVPLAKQAGRLALEMAKIAEDRHDEKLYAPGIVAHEAGHAKVHEPTGRDMALQYGRFGTGVLTSILASRAPNKSSARNIALAGGLTMDTMQLGDEYASTMIGLKKLRDQGKLSKGEMAHEGGRLAAASLSYAATPASRLSTLLKDPTTRRNVSRAIIGGNLAATVPTFSHTGPKVTAREAKELVRAIAPGTDVYASKKPVSGGSLYFNKSYTPIGKSLVYVTTRAMGMNSGDAKRIANRGGVVVAPVTPVGSLGLTLAQSVAQMFAGPVPVPPLTLPGARIRRVRDKSD